MSTLRTVLHPKKDNNGNTIFRLTLRLTVNRKRSYLQLAQNIDPEHWDAHAEKLNSKHPKHKQLNRLIRKKYGEIEDYILDMESSNKSYTASPRPRSAWAVLILVEGFLARPLKQIRHSSTLF